MRGKAKRYSRVRQGLKWKTQAFLVAIRSLRACCHVKEIVSVLKAEKAIDRLVFVSFSPNLRISIVDRRLNEKGWMSDVVENYVATHDS